MLCLGRKKQKSAVQREMLFSFCLFVLVILKLLFVPLLFISPTHSNTINLNSIHKKPTLFNTILGKHYTR